MNANAFSQASGTASSYNDTLTINNVRAAFVPFGNAFWDFNNDRTFEVPAGSGVGTIFTSTLWIGGLDSANVLHLAGETYHTPGYDFSYGPMADTAKISQGQDSSWNVVWKINKSDVDYHKANVGKPNYVAPLIIQYWPAHAGCIAWTKLLFSTLL